MDEITSLAQRFKLGPNQVKMLPGIHRAGQNFSRRRPMPSDGEPEVNGNNLAKKPRPQHRSGKAVAYGTKLGKKGVVGGRKSVKPGMGRRPPGTGPSSPYMKPPTAEDALGVKEKKPLGVQERF